MDTIVEDQLQRIMFALAEEADSEMRRKARQDCLHVAKAYDDLEQKLNGTAPVVAELTTFEGKPAVEFKHANIIDTVEGLCQEDIRYKKE